MAEKPTGVIPETSTLQSSEIRVDAGDFSKLLRNLKRVKKCSNADLTEMLQVPSSSMSAWINGHREPRPDVRKKLEAKIRELLAGPPPETEPEQEPLAPAGDVEPPADRPKMRPLKPGDRRWEVG